VHDLIERGGSTAAAAIGAWCELVGKYHHLLLLLLL
jgi:hypothetical protein